MTHTPCSRKQPWMRMRKLIGWRRAHATLCVRAQRSISLQSSVSLCLLRHALVCGKGPSEKPRSGTSRHWVKTPSVVSAAASRTM
eukprot:332745-Rhodomonas_salina.1